MTAVQKLKHRISLLDLNIAQAREEIRLTRDYRVEAHLRFKIIDLTFLRKTLLAQLHTVSTDA